MQTGLRQLPQKAVVRWNIKPIWFAIMAVRHPRWEVSDERLELVRKKGFFNGSKTSEGKSFSEKMEKVRPGDVVKMVCSDKLVWLPPVKTCTPTLDLNMVYVTCENFKLHV